MEGTGKKFKKDIILSPRLNTNEKTFSIDNLNSPISSLTRTEDSPELKVQNEMLDRLYYTNIKKKRFSKIVLQ
jgi:hypothetical protein